MMKKVVSILNGASAKNDRAYWMSKTPAERFNAIEFLRSQYPDYENQLSAGIQKVCRIIKKET